jgi:hypothetical protein
MAYSRHATVVLLLVGAMCAGVVLSEVVSRAVKRVVCVTAGAKLFAPHPLYGWTHEPHAEGWTHGCIGRAFEWRAFSRMNADGLRDREYAPARRPGVFRVLLLGDSFVEGMQVPLAQTFAKRLEAKLAEDGRDVEVVNAGFSGFGTDNELLFFTTDGHRYQPDVVLLGFTSSNDVIENSRHLYARLCAEVPTGPSPKSHFKLRPDGSLRLDARAARRHWEEIDARRATASGRTWLALEKNLHVVRLLEAVLSPARLRRDAAQVAYSTALGIYATEPSSQWDDAWALTRALLARLESEVERHGATFAAVIVPPKEAVSPAAWQSLLARAHGRRSFDVGRPTSIIEGIFTRDGIPHLDPLPALRAHFEATGRTGYFAWDVHLTEEGHEIVAQALRPFIERVLDERGHATP